MLAMNARPDNWEPDSCWNRSEVCTRCESWLSFFNGLRMTSHGFFLRPRRQILRLKPFQRQWPFVICACAFALSTRRGRADLSFTTFSRWCRCVYDCFWVLGIRKFWSQKEDKEGKSSEREWNFSGAEVEPPSPSTEAQSCQLCRRLSQKMILVDNGRLRSSSNTVLVSANQALSRTFSYLFWSCSVDTLERTVIISAWILLGPSEALLFAAAAKDTGRQFMDKTWQHHERSKVVSQRWQEHCCVKTSSLETCRLPEEVIPCPTVGDCRCDFAKNVTWTLWNPKPMIHNTVL